jgi:hypothetical protein
MEEARPDTGRSQLASRIYRRNLRGRMIRVRSAKAASGFANRLQRAARYPSLPDDYGNSRRSRPQEQRVVSIFEIVAADNRG